jgi:urease accessory protein
MTAEGLCYGHYAVAAGLFIRDIGAQNEEIRYMGLQIFCYSLLACTVNHAAKLVPLRQADAQGALSDVRQQIPEAVKTAQCVELQELGVSGAGFELRAMQHEDLQARLYSS